MEQLEYLEEKNVKDIVKKHSAIHLLPDPACVDQGGRKSSRYVLKSSLSAYYRVVAGGVQGLGDDHPEREAQQALLANATFKRSLKKSRPHYTRALRTIGRTTSP